MIFLAGGNLIESNPVGAFTAPAGVVFTSAPPAPVAPTPAPVAFPSLTLSRVVEDCIASKTRANRRACYLKSLAYYLRRFAKGREAVSISTVTRTELEAFLAECANPWTRATWLNRINTLFSYAYKVDLIEKNPCEKIERVSIEHGAPAILTPDQVEDLLNYVAKRKPHQLGYLALGLFAGLRPTEATRLSWDAINLPGKYLTVSAAVSKVRRRRIVPLQDNAAEWLQLARDRKARLPLGVGAARQYRRHWADVLALPGGWPKDVLRHTGATHMLGLLGDAGRVSTILGNSTEVCYAHYFGAASPEETKRFWSIRPKLDPDKTP